MKSGGGLLNIPFQYSQPVWSWIMRSYTCQIIRVVTVYRLESVSLVIRKDFVRRVGDLIWSSYNEYLWSVEVFFVIQLCSVYESYVPTSLGTWDSFHTDLVGDKCIKNNNKLIRHCHFVERVIVCLCIIDVFVKALFLYEHTHGALTSVMYCVINNEVFNVNMRHLLKVIFWETRSRYIKFRKACISQVVLKRSGYFLIYEVRVFFIKCNF